MRKRRRGVDTVQPSLVPMVDLLSNTVGALVFIMIFTVMAASGVVVLKRLPLEHSSTSEPVNFLCEGGRVIPLNNLALSKRLRQKWGSPYTLYDIYSWIARFNGIEAEDEHFVARGQSSVSHTSYSFSILFTPKPGSGYTKEAIDHANSAFRKQLAGLNSKKEFVHFYVRPRSIETFFAARKIATEEMGLRSGWMPLSATDELRFAAQGRSATEQ